MTDSLKELQVHEYRQNLPSIKVSAIGPKGTDPTFFYSIPMDNPEEAASVIQSILRQAMESQNVVTEVTNSVYLPNGQTLLNVHKESACEGRGCSVHHPSNNHMKSWSQNYRTDRGMMERICVHGVGHPDIDDRNFHENIVKDEFDFTHGCDTCCQPPRKPQAKKPIALN